MKIYTDRLEICEFSHDMASGLCAVSCEEGGRIFLPDEVCETEEAAHQAISRFIAEYNGTRGPFVYALHTRQGRRYVGHVECAVTNDGLWEVGVHVSQNEAGKGYASEALLAFMPAMAGRLGTDCLYGICLEENIASRRMLEKCGFKLKYCGKGRYLGREKDIRKYIWHMPK